MGLALSVCNGARSDWRQRWRIPQLGQEIVAFVARHFRALLPTCRRNYQHIVNRGQCVRSLAVRQRYRHSPTGANGRSSPLPLSQPELIELGISHDTRSKWPDSCNHRNLVTWPGMAGTASPRRPCRNGSVTTFFPCAFRPFLAKQERRACVVLHCISALAHPKKYYFLGTPSWVRRAFALPLTGHRDRDGRGIDPTKEKYHG